MGDKRFSIFSLLFEQIFSRQVNAQDEEGGGKRWGETKKGAIYKNKYIASSRTKKKKKERVFLKIAMLHRRHLKTWNRSRIYSCLHFPLLLLLSRLVAKQNLQA